MKLFRISGDQVDAIPERSYRDKEVAGFGESTLEHILVNNKGVLNDDAKNVHAPLNQWQ